MMIMKMKRWLPLLSIALFGWMAAALAQEIKNESFEAKILSPLSASTSKKGDRFTLQVVSPAQYQNAMIEGEVTKAKAAGRVKGKSELLFSFKKLVLANGKEVPIVADLTGISNSKGVKDVDEEGRVIGKSSVKKDVATTAVASGVGAALGGIFGGGSGAAKGAAIGAAVGLTITFSTKGEDIKLAPGSVFLLTVNSSTAKGK
jgi:hypothetical protein